jgi:multiple sugar transport system substrate-binding protein
MKRVVRTMACLSLVTALGLLAGCPKPKPPEGGPTPVAPGAKAGGGVEISFLAMEYDTGTRGYWNKVQDEFNASGQGVRVNIEVVDWNAGHQKIATLIGAGHAPDLVNIETLWLPEYLDMKIVEPLDDLVTPEFRERFIPITLHGAERDGRLWGLPIAVSARALYYNKDLLSNAGVTQPPKTWKELVAAAQAVTRKTDAYGFGVQGAKIETDTYWYYFLWNNGGEILDDKGLAAFNSPEGVESLQFLVDLVHKYKVSEPDPTGNEREDLQDLFKAGRLAMMITGPWFWGMLDREAPTIRYGLAPIPTNKDQVTMAVTDNLIMFNTCKDKQAAWKFVEFMYDTDRRLEWAKSTGMLPELESVAASDFIQKSEQWRTFMELLETGRFVPLHEDWAKIAEEIKNAVQKALLQEATPKQALDEAKKRVDQIIQGAQGA